MIEDVDSATVHDTPGRLSAEDREAEAAREELSLLRERERAWRVVENLNSRLGPLADVRKLRVRSDAVARVVHAEEAIAAYYAAHPEALEER